jgi:hypothetical protein
LGRADDVSLNVCSTLKYSRLAVCASNRGQTALVPGLVYAALILRAGLLCLLAGVVAVTSLRGFRWLPTPTHYTLAIRMNLARLMARPIRTILP